jgi:hypothetical protein
MMKACRTAILAGCTFFAILIEVSAWGCCFYGHPFSSSAGSSRNSRKGTSTMMFLYQNGPEDTRKVSSSPSSAYLPSSPTAQQSSPHNNTRLYYQNDKTPTEFSTQDRVNNIVETEDDQKEATTGTLGDIMSGPIQRNEKSTKGVLSDGLVTSESASLSRAFGIHNPLDRMAVTANGNLQRIFSSYYDTPVRVRVEKCERRQYAQPSPQEQQREQRHREGNSYADRRLDEIVSGTAGTVPTIKSTTLTREAVAVWDRRVLLTIFDCEDDEITESSTSSSRTVLCRADSVIYVHDSQVESLVESGQVGIGQLFRHFNILPDFHLIEAGRCCPPVKNEVDGVALDSNDPQDEGFWRRYQLTSDLVTCDIYEVFCPNLWELSPPRPSTAEPQREL